MFVLCDHEYKPNCFIKVRFFQSQENWLFQKKNYNITFSAYNVQMEIYASYQRQRQDTTRKWNK